MAAPEKRSPARDGARNRADKVNQVALDNTARRELEGLAYRLHAMGPRPIFELLRDMLTGRDPAVIVADFARLDPATFAALAALFIERGRA